MITGKVIYGILGATTAIQTLVSSRIYPHIAPQGVSMPFVTFATIQRRPTDTKNNVSKLDVYQVEINIFDPEYTACCTIADAIRTALDQKKDTTVNSVSVDSIWYDSGVELYDETANVFVIQETYNMRIKR